MTRPLPPLDGVDIQPASRVDWAGIVSRIRMADSLLLLAGGISAFADPDGYVADLDLTRFVDLVAADEDAVREKLTALCAEYGLLRPVNSCGVACCRNTSYHLTLPADATDRFDLVDADAIRIRRSPTEDRT